MCSTLLLGLQAQLEMVWIKHCVSLPQINIEWWACFSPCSKVIHWTSVCQNCLLPLFQFKSSFKALIQSSLPSFTSRCLPSAFITLWSPISWKALAVRSLNSPVYLPPALPCLLAWALGAGRIIKPARNQCAPGNLLSAPHPLFPHPPHPPSTTMTCRTNCSLFSYPSSLHSLITSLEQGLCLLWFSFFEISLF